MKKLLLLISVCLTLHSKAQTSVYHPFPDSNATWTISGQGCCNFNCPSPPFNNIGLTDINLSYYLRGDTIINGFTYHNVYQSSTRHEHCQFGNYVNNWYSYYDQYAFLYRQDTLAKKVFIFLNPGELLLYDFSLNVGDTVPFDNCAVITSIDSVLIGNNYRKRFNLSTSLPYSIIEGIGSTSGPIEPLCPFEYYANLVCFSQNGQTLYPDTVTACQMVTHVPELPEKISSYVFPNPFHSSATLEISNGDFENSLLNIYNVFGEQVKRQTLINKTITIYREGLSSGIYFFQAANPQGHVMSGKFIVE